VETVTVPAIGVLRLSCLHAVGDLLQASSVRLDAIGMGRAHGLDAEAVERLGVVVTEMAANIARHAKVGQIILRRVGEGPTGCIEVLALDKGPGIADKARVMRDAATPAGGVPRDGGLSTVRRLADLFDIYSHPGCGTAVVVHVGSRGDQPVAARCEDSVTHDSVGAVCVALKGEHECGDAWMLDIAPGRLTAMLVDGLGHGPEAAMAAGAAMATFQEVLADPPELMLAAMHTALRPTRGAATSVAVIDEARRTVRFCGVGNVDGRILTADSNRHLVPQNGIVGHTMPRAQCDDVPWPTAGRLVLHSDGISSRWQADRYPGLLARHPALLAGVLFRDCARERDDATVIVIRAGSVNATR
jgi:anti-sigma regulatory factor (Ser/Thr protein kinase)